MIGASLSSGMGTRQTVQLLLQPGNLRNQPQPLRTVQRNGERRNRVSLIPLRQMTTVGPLGIGQPPIGKSPPFRNPAQPQQIGGNLRPALRNLVQLQRALKFPFRDFILAALLRQNPQVHMIAGLGSEVPRGLIQGHRLPEQLFCLSGISRRLPD